MKMARTGMTMRSVFRVNRTFVGRLALRSCAFFTNIMLGGMMNVFFRGVSGRDNADCAP